MEPGGFVTRMLTGLFERLPAIASDVKTEWLNPSLPHPLYHSSFPWVLVALLFGCTSVTCKLCKLNPHPSTKLIFLFYVTLFK